MELAISSEADTYVRDGSYSNNNYGGLSKLGVQTGSSGSVYYSYIRFDLSSITETVTSAKLSFYSSKFDFSGPFTGTHTAKLVTDNSWNETTLTWNNQPAAGTNKRLGGQVLKYKNRKNRVSHHGSPLEDRIPPRGLPCDLPG
jgi:hypothetical protein